MIEVSGVFVFELCPCFEHILESRNELDKAMRMLFYDMLAELLEHSLL